jgi:hypothetical protein
MEPEQRHREVAAVGLAVAVVANLVHAAIVPLGGTAPEQLDAAAARPGVTSLAVVADVVFRVALSVGAVSLARVLRRRAGVAALGSALVVAGGLASVLANAPLLVRAQAPADPAGRRAVLDAVGGLTGTPAFLGLTVAGLLVLTVGTAALLVALRPAGWAPVWVLVAFLAGGVASLVGADARPGLFGGALLTGAALASVAVRVVRPGRVAAAARPHG